MTGFFTSQITENYGATYGLGCYKINVDHGSSNGLLGSNVPRDNKVSKITGP